MHQKWQKNYTWSKNNLQYTKEKEKLLKQKLETCRFVILLDVLDFKTFLKVKLEDAENNSIKHGKKMIGRLEEKIRELVAELDNEERRRSEALKNLKKTERGVNEYLYRANEDNRNSERIKVFLQILSKWSVIQIVFRI